jgi:hypothetical protein
VLAAGLLLVCALLPYAGTWAFGFVDYDDRAGIVDLPLIRSLSWRALPQFFRPDVYPGLPEYMPLKNLSYAIDYARFGLWAPGYRLQQQLWYALAVLLFWSWLRALLRALADAGRLGMAAARADGLALVTALLFALHPVHVESMTWLSGRKDVLSGTFMFATLLCAWWWRRTPRHAPAWLLAGFASCALALLSKPMAVVLPALIVLQDWVCDARPLRQLARERAPLYAGMFALALGFAAFYLDLVQPYSLASAEIAPRLYRGPSFARWGQQLIVFAELALAPSRLAPFYPPDVLDANPLSARALIGLFAVCAFGALFALALRKRHPLALALGLFVIPLAPIVAAPPWGQYVAGRYMFHAVAGVLFAITWTAAFALDRRPHLRSVVAAAALLFAALLALGTLGYNRDFKDSLSLWSAAIERYPRFAAFYDLAARAAARARNPALAAQFWSHCLQVDADDAQCNTGLGRVLLFTDPDRGARLLQRALPRDLSGEAHLALAQLEVERGHAAQAVALYQRWLNGRPAGVEQIEALARLALRAHQYDKALDAARQVVRAGALNAPAGPPPARLLRDVANARGDAALSAEIDTVLARCNRVDCAKHVLGW